MPNDLELYFLTVNYYATSLILELFTSLQELSIPFRFIIVNNSPDDPGIKQFSWQNIEVIEPGNNLGFGRACNLGLELIYTRSGGATVWLINPDASFLLTDLAKIPQTLTIVKHYPIVGTVICNQDGNITFSGGKFHWLWGKIQEEIHPLEEEVQLTSWVSGCSMVLNLYHFKQCPQFDRDFFLYYEDFEFCRRYHKLGFPIVICNRVKVIHKTSSITSKLQNGKLTQEIFSYLLALAKQGSKLGLLYRLVRIFVVSMGQIIGNNPKGRAKLRGVGLFLSQFCLAHNFE